MSVHAYTDIEAIESKLRTVLGRIVIAEAEPVPGSTTTEMSTATVEQIRIGAESMIENHLGRWYDTPLALTASKTIALLKDIATKLAAYNVWTTMHPAMATADLPASVKDWKADVEHVLESIVPKGKANYVEGRDVRLEGEALAHAGSDRTTANVQFTTLLPFGGST